MRLRNIPGSRERIDKSEYCVSEPREFKGKWNSLFGNNNPIHIEIGMGKGLFLIRMAEQNPNINYIGIEMYSSVLIRAVERAEKARTARPDAVHGENFLFIRMDAKEITKIFEYGEIERIYLNFSDPWPKDRHIKRRLTSGDFLRRYKKTLAKGGRVEFKTDNSDLFEFSIEEARREGWEILAVTRDLHNDPVMNGGNVMTEYEEKFSAGGNPISKLIIKVS